MPSECECVAGANGKSFNKTLEMQFSISSLVAYNIFSQQRHRKCDFFSIFRHRVVEVESVDILNSFELCRFTKQFHNYTIALFYTQPKFQ